MNKQPFLPTRDVVKRKIMRILALTVLASLCACSDRVSNDAAHSPLISSSSPAQATSAALATESPSSNSPYLLDDLYAQARLIKLKEIRLIDSTTKTLADGDFTSPKFSPDSKKLAYSNEVLLDTQEGKLGVAEVSILDLESKESLLVLPREQAKNYAVYAAFVTSMNWPNTGQIQVNLSDGDVDGTELLINASTRKMISEKNIEAGIDEEVDRGVNSRVEKLISKFPTWEPEVLKNAIEHNSLAIEDQAIILQRAYYGYDNNILLLDLSKNKEQLLIRMRDQDRNSLVGGIVVDGEAIFSVRREDGVGIFKLTKKHMIAPLAFFPMEKGMAFPWLVVQHTSPSEAYLMLRLYSPSTPGSNPLLYYSASSGLFSVIDFTGTYQFDISDDRQLMAVSFWEKERRKLSVVRLSKNALSQQ